MEQVAPQQHEISAVLLCDLKHLDKVDGGGVRGGHLGRKQASVPSSLLPRGATPAPTRTLRQDRRTAVVCTSARVRCSGTMLTSSKARKESSLRTSSFSHTPCKVQDGWEREVDGEA